jgi:periplasmic protein CpxP/Spy
MHEEGEFMLKHCLLALTLVALTYAVTPLAVGQDNGNAQEQSAPEHARRHFDPAKRAEMLGKQLNLNSDQQGKVLDIFKSEQSQMESLRSDTSLSQEDRRSKMMDIHKTSNDQVRALLTPDQQKKFDEMQSRHGNWGHQGGQGNEGSQAPPQ